LGEIGENGSGPVAPGSAGVVFDLPDNAEGSLRIVAQASDAMDVDNIAYAVLTPAQPIRVLLVSGGEGGDFKGSYFIESALSVDAKNTVYYLMAAADYPKRGVPRGKDGKRYEMIIFDRFAPDEVPPGASLFIDVVPKLPDISVHEKPDMLFAPIVVDWNRSHPLMRGMSLLDKLSILRCRNLKLDGAWASVMDGQGIELASAEELSDPAKVAKAKEDEVPLLACMISEERRVAVLGFNIWETERWPWRVSFPLFIKNSVHWLARPAGIQRAVSYHTGETLRVEYNDEVSNVVVQGPPPADEIFKPTMSGTRSLYFSRTYDSGLYRVKAEGAEDQLFAFNLLSSSESYNTARSKIRFGDEEVDGVKGESRTNLDLWPYLAGLALVFLFVEWYVYNRRVLG
ncbi:MAG: hypothetical protein JXR97_10745, partial [Planctomycetes bacterium]|nr:hypothetical protein [Planctomycetota bacterium]